MHIASLLLPLLAATGTTANGRGFTLPQDLGVDNEPATYPLCPEHYDTYCCFLVTPYTNSCRRGRCTSGLGWTCAAGPGKVDSIRTCLEEVGGNMRAFCKRPGEAYFPSVIEWNGYSSFKPVLAPSDYRRWVKPGMHKPWTPAWDEIRWEDEEGVEDSADEEGLELRKRDFEERNDDMI